MKGANHLLQKVTFEIGLASQENAFEIQNRISQAFQTAVIRKLEPLFDQVSIEGYVITIDRMEIDLGQLSVHRLEEELRDSVERNLEAFLASLQQEVANAAASPSDKPRNIRVRWPLPAQAHFEAEVAVSSDHISLFDKIAHLLEYGLLPASTLHESRVRLQDMIVPVLNEQPELLLGFIRNHITDTNVLSRVVLNLTRAQQQYIAALAGCPFSFQLPDLIAEMTAFLQEHSISVADFTSEKLPGLHKQEDVLWYHVLLYFFRRTEGKSVGQEAANDEKVVLLMRLLLAEAGVLEKILVRYKSTTKSKPNLKITALEKMRGQYPLVYAALKSIISSLPSGWIQSDAREDTVANKIHGKSLKQSPEANYVDEGQLRRADGAPGEDVSVFRQQEEDLPMIVDAGIYIQNAGLIILSPYLKMLFGNLGYLDGKSFINEEFQQRAVHVLQYACGYNADETHEDSVSGEHSLLFNKILCGMELNAPVPEHLELTAVEKEEAENLLKAVIRNWTIMQRSSVRTLQVTFLQKQGRLSKTGKDWEMLVERDSAVEILIDKLPWAISLVKLPWNKYAIHTHW